MIRARAYKFHPLLFLSLFLIASIAGAYDLGGVKTEKLSNGLTVIVLEDHTQPLVSTQMLYRVGSRNECVGTTGLAHFMEHMAFRATKHFPNSEVVSKIYAIGGEWHGYTWIDQTTYFETVPVQDLDLVLQIQADRMNEVVNSSDELEAERGAVLTELHSYENDPSSLLNDAVVAASFEEHPYRYNVIGWTSDVEKITHDDLVRFYKRYYNPSNAVFAIVGDVRTSDVLDRVRKYFSPIPSGARAESPRTVEPPQNGERRVQLRGSGPFNYFQISYRAPAARESDYPPFLLLQAILTGSGGVNFRQRGSGEFPRSGTRLFGLPFRISTFFIPTADPYLFSFSGRVPPSTNTVEIEQAVEQKLAELRQAPPSPEELEKARKQFFEELVFDIETTEDAAHQMASFEGIDAFPVLKNLEALIQKVTPADIQRITQKYFQPYQRTIGWYETGRTDPIQKSSLPAEPPSPFRAKEAPSRAVMQPPITQKLRNGMILIVQRVTRTPTGFLRILFPSRSLQTDQADYSQDLPAWGYTSIHWRFLKENLERTLLQARKVVFSGSKTAPPDPASLDDPEYRLNSALQEQFGIVESAAKNGPVLIAMVGDVNEKTAFDLLKKTFSDMPAGGVPSPTPFHPVAGTKTVRMPSRPQSQFGYAVAAPAPSNRQSYAYRLLLYIMTHTYEGRLGKELIGEKGLIYAISSRYNSNGPSAWISITTGVNPDKLAALTTGFREILSQLQTDPPTEAEVSEAKENLIGRRLTANQSNEELSAFYAQEWIEQGRLLTFAEFEKQVRSVTLQDILSIIPQFLSGSTVIVDTSP